MYINRTPLFNQRAIKAIYSISLGVIWGIILTGILDTADIISKLPETPISLSIKLES